MKYKQKPIIKWLIGPVLEEGYQCLNIAIENAWLLYGKSVEYYLCYNNISTKVIQSKLKIPYGVSLRLFDQTAYRRSSDNEYGWKFYPLRITDNQRELWMDNDIVLYERNELIDKFLFGADDNFIFLQDVQCAYTPSIFSKVLPQNIFICGGLFGLPVLNMDELYNKYICYIKSNNIAEKYTHFTCDNISYLGAENASIAIFTQIFPHQSLIINQNDIPVGKAIRQGLLGRCGLHFNGLNRGPHPAILSIFNELVQCSLRPRRIR